MSDRITWESCPVCRHLAAVGWSGDQVVEFDCTSACEPTPEELDEVQARQSHSSE